MKPFIYVHELLENGGGIWLGCDDEAVVRSAYDKGEIGEEVITLVKLSDAQAVLDKLEILLEKVQCDAGFRNLDENLQEEILSVV
jgi:hypothetical protein